jgi:hypothetical protein
MRRASRATDELTWALLGAALGTAAGFLLGTWLGPVDRRRASRALRAMGRAEPPWTAALSAAAARQALAADPTLSPLELTVLPVAPGTVELHGWVESRAIRARAARALRDIEGLDTVINGLLVRGEDDGFAAPVPPVERPA